MEKMYNYLIVGGGIAGTTAAEAIRASDHIGSIAILEKEPYLLYSRVLLPQYAERVIAEEAIFLRRLGDYEDKKIDIFVGDPVMAINPDRREVRTAGGKVFYYEKILITTGGRTCEWQLGKSIAERVVRLQSLDDAKRIVEVVRQFKTVPLPGKDAGARAGRILVVGGGFISLDLVDIFAKAGFAVVFFNRNKRFWENILDENGSRILQDMWHSKKIDLIFDDEIVSIEPAAEGVIITTKRGEKRMVDIVGVGIGLDRNLEMVRGIAEIARGVKVNEFMETSRSGVWAAGDVVEYADQYTGDIRLCIGWGEAFLQGRVAGFNMTLAVNDKDHRKKFDALATNSSDHLSAVVTTIGTTKVAEGIVIQTRYNPVTGRYARFFLRNNMMIGAVLINANNLLGPCTRLIKARKDLTTHLGDLASNNFDLSMIK
jgi:NADPH-dependent 2,4-dienoyl-CoA reductase/sulfur reductase-like enzyme